MYSKTLRAAFALLLLAFSYLFAGAPAAAEDYLEPDVAFKFSAQMMDPQTVAVTYDIADGYYMYRERFQFKAEGALLGQPVIPPGKVKYDETFQKDVEMHRGRVTISIPVQASGMFTLIATSQGCADAGLCYAPQDASARLVGALANGAVASGSTAVLASGSAVPTSDLSGIAAILGGGKLLVIVPAFILLGLGLSFTPCVLPMVPILASIIVGEGAQTKRGRGFVLALSYSLGMAVVYTALGVAAGLIGEGLSATLQNPWVLGVVALLIVAMALSMFNVYQLQLPAALQSRLVALSTRQRSGKLFGVFVMGAVSALIVGPCVAAPLAGALVYISQTRDVVLGGSALFAMAVGMSIPLLLVGLSAGALLPRAGAWMDSVKSFFGVLMLAMAVWLVSPVIPPVLTMAAWGLLGIGYAVFLLMRSRHAVALTVAALFALLGGMQLAGMASGGRDPLAPLAHLGEQEHGLAFKRVKTLAQLDAALADTGGKTVMLDFYADWCVSCKEMEKLTFVDPGVKALLADTILLQVDVTANDADDKAMLKRFKLFGPPGIILFDANGKEIDDSRVIGYQNAEKFRISLQKLR